MSVTLTQDTFGEINYNGEIKPIKRFTWTNSNKIKVQLMNYGGTITVIEVPDKSGKVEDIALGFNNFNDYLKPENDRFGTTIGRVASRIKNGEMIVENIKYQLTKNNGPHHLHGGSRGFDKALFESYVQGEKVTLSYLSPDNEQGYPGDLLVNITFQLTEENEIVIDYKATTTKTTPVNLTNHSYFNLGGSDSGSKEIYKHIVTINSDKITETDTERLPTGKFLQTAGTIFDFRVPTKLGDVINKITNCPGYDHYFCITKGTTQDYAFAASVFHPENGRVMEVYTDQPGIHFYTGNSLPEDKTLKGKTEYIRKHDGLCLEPLLYPDAVNQVNFPSVLLYPGQVYKQKTVYKFSVRNN